MGLTRVVFVLSDYWDIYGSLFTSYLNITFLSLNVASFLSSYIFFSFYLAETRGHKVMRDAYSAEGQRGGIALSQLCFISMTSVQKYDSSYIWCI